MYGPSQVGTVFGEPARRLGAVVRAGADPTTERHDLQRSGEGAQTCGAVGKIDRGAAHIDGGREKRLAHGRYFYRKNSTDVKSPLTGMSTPMTEPMQLVEVLERIEARLKLLKMTENAASQAAGKPDAIRNLRRGVRSGARKGISTATLAALAPVLKTNVEWLMTGRSGPDGAQTAVEAVVSLPYTDAILALTLAFEALRIGSDAECRILARAVLAATRTRQSPRGGPFSDEERRQLVSEAIRLFRTQ